jgi:hypothetical protein
MKNGVLGLTASRCTFVVFLSLPEDEICITMQSSQCYYRMDTHINVKSHSVGFKMNMRAQRGENDAV